MMKLSKVGEKIFAFCFKEKTFALMMFLLLILASNQLQASSYVSAINVSGAQSSSLTYGTGNTVTYDIMLTIGGNGNGYTRLSINWAGGVTPTGVTETFSVPMPINLKDLSSPYQVTLTITTTASTPVVNTSFTVTSSVWPTPTSSPASTFVINPKALTITANNQLKCFGQVFTFSGKEFTVSGLVNSDAVSSVTLTSAGSGAGAAVGSYSIVPSSALGTGLSNYSITYNNGTLTIPENTITAPSVTTFCATSSGSDITIVGSDLGPGATYQWQINTNANDLDNTWSYSNISGATSKDYNPGTITTTTGYRRVSSTCSSISNIVKMFVIPGIPVSVSIAANPGTTICAGTSVTFTATPTNGGTTPAYQWKLNGTNVGSNSPTYTTTTLANGNVVTCELTSNVSCPTGNPATSNSLTMTVNLLPVPTFTPAPADPECQGDDVTYTTQSGMSNYTWSVSGTDGSDYSITSGGIGSNSVTLKWLTTGSKTVTVGYTGGNGCASASPATSTITVNPTPVIGTFN